MGISSAAVPHRGVRVARRELRIVSVGRMATHRFSMVRRDGYLAGWHQSVIRGSIFRHRNHLRHPGLCILLGRVRIVRPHAPGWAPDSLGGPGSRLVPVRGCAGRQRDLGIAASRRGALRVSLVSARRLEREGVVTLDMARRQVRVYRRIARHWLHHRQAAWSRFIVASRGVPADVLRRLVGTLSQSAHI